MPQLTQFPYLPIKNPREAVISLIRFCNEVPAEGEPFKRFRQRMREHKLYDRERLGDLLRFFRMAKGDIIVPSDEMKAVASADGDEASRVVLTERMWAANPVLFKVIIERLSEEVQPPKEVYNFLDSVNYRGVAVPRRQLESWMHMARGLGLIKILGIAFTLGERGEKLKERAHSFDLDEFFEEDEPETVPEPILTGEGDDESDAAPAAEAPEVSTAAVAAAAPVTPRVPVTSKYSSPHKRERRVPVSTFVGDAGFSDDVLAETTRRLESWWGEQAEKPDPSGVKDFGVDSERWMESADETLYRLAVAAALVFRLGRDRQSVKSVFVVLDETGVLDDLYYGTAPDNLPGGVDPQALMLASLVARRCAESPDLAANLEKQSTAAEAFAVLDGALGRGLFKLELFWLMRQLQELGALRFEDLSDFVALPTRLVRDTLFRLGFLDSPYAHDASSLIPAAAAVRRAAGEAHPPDEVISGFAVAAGCAYDCPNRRGCEFACRERGE